MLLTATEIQAKLENPSIWARSNHMQQYSPFNIFFQYKYTGDYTKSRALIGSLSRIISR